MSSQYPGNRDIRELHVGAPPQPRPEPLEALEREEHTGPFIHVAEYIPVKRWGHVWPFMKLSMEIYRQARTYPGFVAGGIRAKWWRRQFWSYSVWEDRESMERFVRSAPHSRAVALIGEVAAPGACYVEWTTHAPPDWEQAMERLRFPTRYFVPPG